ncbi:DUF4278 domain-containing protein [Nostoc sp. FACHB-110]|uniref:DUF4278 domain-containing protein n=1 Tax=Nostoc sp. FACHB-110 TaxID=2692834 RepID=UPI001687385D|nr:DUF4278 domain-containing protein [Nostoc sp. FACHB-110]MBD2440329.1 DUF4278 domain-containing protein [Nostoc sp. FACHB-110]
MVLCFLIIVCTCLITGYFLLKDSQRDIAHLLGIFGTLSLILALVLAPWQILIVLLLSGLISTNFKYRTNNLNHIQVEFTQQPVNKIKADHHLIYRGVTYLTHSNGVSQLQESHQLSYRGSTYLSGIDSQVLTPETIPPEATCQLRFRGNPYYINKTTVIQEKITTTSLPVAH